MYRQARCRFLSRAEKLPRGNRDPSLLVGYDSRDDAAVYKISVMRPLCRLWISFHRWWMIPATFGQIAAANALSDIYAMGGGGQDSAEYCLLP